MVGFCTSLFLFCFFSYRTINIRYIEISHIYWMPVLGELVLYYGVKDSTFNVSPFPFSSIENGSKMYNIAHVKIWLLYTSIRLTARWLSYKWLLYFQFHRKEHIWKGIQLIVIVTVIPQWTTNEDQNTGLWEGCDVPAKR